MIPGQKWLFQLNPWDFALLQPACHFTGFREYMGLRKWLFAWFGESWIGLVAWVFVFWALISPLLNGNPL